MHSALVVFRVPQSAGYNSTISRSCWRPLLSARLDIGICMCGMEVFSLSLSGFAPTAPHSDCVTAAATPRERGEEREPPFDDDDTQCLLAGLYEYRQKTMYGIRLLLLFVVVPWVAV